MTRCFFVENTSIPVRNRLFYTKRLSKGIVYWVQVCNQQVKKKVTLKKTQEMDKSQLLQLIHQQLENNVLELNHSLDTYRSGSDMDEDDTRDPEDFSQQNESRDMVLLMQQQLDNANALLNRLESLAEKHNTTIEPGAMVETDKNIFFIGLSFPSFRSSGKEIIGISSESPAYTLIK